MSEVPTRYRLYVAREVADDLAYVQSEDVIAYDEMQVFFEDLEGDESWCACIADPNYTDGQIEDVKALEYMQNERRNIYRLKFYEIAKWRIFTAADHRTKKIGILGIMHRSQDYEKDSEFSMRIKDSYDALEFAPI